MYKSLNPILHAPLRLSIVSLLMGVEEAEFVFLKEKTKATAGNLSLQLNQLNEAGYVSIKKKFKGNYPVTLCRLTPKGKKALYEYVSTLKQILPNLES